jgi:hypothetical protein
MANVFVSVLDAIGKDFEKFFSVALPIAQQAEPIVADLAPWVSPLYNLTVNTVKAAEVAAAAAGQQSGTGPQKLAFVLSATQPFVLSYLQSQGVSAPTTAQYSQYISLVVAQLNLFSGLSAPIAPPAPAPSIAAAATTITTEVTH